MHLDQALRSRPARPRSQRLRLLGQSGNRDNEVKVAAQKLIGQPAGKAFELFGKPDQGLGPSSYGSGGFYAWNRVRTHMGPDKVFIQTGTEYVGQRETWVGVGGQGVAGMAPVSSEAAPSQDRLLRERDHPRLFLQHHPVHRQPGHHHQRQRDRLPGQPLTGPPGPGLPSRRRTPDAEALRTMALRYRFYFLESLFSYLLFRLEIR